MSRGQKVESMFTEIREAVKLVPMISDSEIIFCKRTDLKNLKTAREDVLEKQFFRL